MERTVTTALENQLASTLRMAEVLVEVCPDHIWAQSYNGVPFWQQVFHYVYFADFWLRDDPAAPDFRCMSFDDALTTDLYADSYEGLFVCRADMLEYLKRIRAKAGRFFAALDDQRIKEPVSAQAFPFIDNPAAYTHVDVITGQIRHFMYNIGYLNGILRQHGLPESDWYAYNEPEGS